MADFSTYIVYFNATGAAASVNINQGVYVAAVADAAAGATYIADSGNLAQAREDYGEGELVVSSAAVTIPHTPEAVISQYSIAVPGQAWYDSTAMTLGFARIVQFPLRGAATLFHNELIRLAQILQEPDIPIKYPEEDIVFARNILYGLERGNYMVVKSTAITTQQKLRFMGLAAIGPADADAGGQIYSSTNPESFFRIAARIPSANRAITGPLFLVEFDSNRGTLYQRQTITQMVASPLLPALPAFTGLTVPTVDTLDGGKWIEGVNA